MELEAFRQRISALDTSCFADADKTLRVMDAEIAPVRPDAMLVGRAFTVTCRDDFLTVIQALALAKPGDVLVVDCQGSRLAVAGELFATEAKRKSLAGIVVDGAVRDVAVLREIDLPVYSRSTFPASGTTSKLFSCGESITCGGVVVEPGEIVIGDQDGIVVCSEAELERLLPIAEQIKATEDKAMERMRNGESLLEMLNFEEHVSAVSSGDGSSKLRFKI